MRDKKKKEADITSPTAAGSENPARDFLVMLSIIITTPFILTYSILRGRVKSPLVVVGFLIAIMVGLYYLSTSGSISKKHLKEKILHQTIEELTPEEKEELRSEISTLRESTDAEKFPGALNPLLDVPMDMLSINYLLFMLHSGYIMPNGGGSEFILDRYLHSKHKLLREKSWEALQNIPTEEAARVIKNYELEVARKKEEFKAKYGTKIRDTGVVEDLQNTIKDNLINLK
jgi:hypothetical protein